MVNIYIYDLRELNMIMKDNCPLVKLPEGDIYNLFVRQLRKNYNIVNDIKTADIAFIPIDFVKMLYVRPINYLKKIVNGTPKLPQVTGTSCKKYLINYYWTKYVKNKINNISIPHFIFYSYVLFDIDFSDIPKNIFIVCYEKNVSLFNVLKCVDNGTHDRTIMIPYILNASPNYNQYQITNTYFSNYTLTDLIACKKTDIGFFGTIYASVNKHIQRNVLSYYRNFLQNFNFNKFKYKINSTFQGYHDLIDIKYLFVLRGDTPTRICFYQCFAFNVVPIIYESELELYKNLLFSENINIENSVLTIPNITESNSSYYSEIVENILTSELSNVDNYIQKIKMHNEIFNNFNYFTEPLALPISNVINKLLTHKSSYLTSTNDNNSYNTVVDIQQKHNRWVEYLKKQQTLIHSRKKTHHKL